MLEQLIALFEGKPVQITHTNKRVKDEEGVCKTVHAVPGTEGLFDLELTNGSRFGFVPEVVTATFADGELPALASGRRKIELV